MKKWNLLAAVFQTVVGIAAIIAYIVVAVYVSSLKTKRHTAPQLLGGSFIPMASLVIINLLYFLIA